MGSPLTALWSPNHRFQRGSLSQEGFLPCLLLPMLRRVLVYISQATFFFLPFISKVFVIAYLQQSRHHPEFDILPDVQKSYSVMYYSIKNTQECSPKTISRFFHRLPALRILHQDLRAALQHSCASAGSASRVCNSASLNEGVPSPKYPLLFANCI